jgi:hypothetical protein
MGRRMLREQLLKKLRGETYLRLFGARVNAGR